MDRVSAEDLFDLRDNILELEARRIEMALAQNLVNRCMLTLEQKYELLATDSNLDINTGKITKVEDGPKIEEVT